jgi:hypothetical protein
VEEAAANSLPNLGDDVVHVPLERESYAASPQAGVEQPHYQSIKIR